MKKILLSLSITFISIIGYAANVNIPDANFKAYLIGNTSINKNNDTEISVEEAENFTGIINCANKNISDLTGIKSFVNIIKLYCHTNSLTSLDVSGLSKMRELYCYDNSLTSLDVTGLTSLTFLTCPNNSLISLDATGLTNLITLYCHTNSLTSLDVTGLTKLVNIQCHTNSLTSLNVNTLTSLKYLKCYTNTNLNEICVSINQDTSNPSNWIKDASAEWVTNCTPLAFEEIHSIEKASIIKAYNLHGQEVPVNTRGEVIILLYDNGLREKTYVAE